MDIKELVNSSNNIVFFGGAGVSTECGIPDFRGVDGLYSQSTITRQKQFYPIHFYKNTTEFYRFYRNKMIFLDAKPNITHKVLQSLKRKEVKSNHYAKH